MTKKAMVVFKQRWDKQAQTIREDCKNEVYYEAYQRDTANGKSQPYGNERKVFVDDYWSDDYPRCTGGYGANVRSRTESHLRIQNENDLSRKYWQIIAILPLEFFS